MFSALEIFLGMRYINLLFTYLLLLLLPRSYLLTVLPSVVLEVDVCCLGHVKNRLILINWPVFLEPLWVRTVSQSKHTEHYCGIIFTARMHYLLLNLQHHSTDLHQWTLNNEVMN